MSKLTLSKVTTIAPPSEGKISIFTDEAGKLFTMDHLGNITAVTPEIALPVLETYPETDATKAGTRFLYKGNEWHYMTQAEIDSTGWTGLVEVGFPAPVSKNINFTIMANASAFNHNATSPRDIYLNPSNYIDKPFIFDFLGYGLPNLLTQTIKMSLSGPAGIYYDIISIKNAHLLVNLIDVGTSPALQINNSNLTAEKLNQLFTDLPATTNTATIHLLYNTGSATCDPTIATSKGYTVVTSL